MVGRRALRLVAIGLLLVVAGLASWLGGFDSASANELRLPIGSAWARVVVPLSTSGGLAVEGPIALVACVVLLARRRSGDAAWLAATIVTGRLLVELLKIAVERPRPPAIDRLELVTSWSFPSSHSAGATMTALAVVLAFGGGARWVAAALLYAGAIGWSRLALGVHWPGDVLTGWGIGLLWVGLALAGRAIASPHAPPAPA